MINVSGSISAISTLSKEFSKHITNQFDSFELDVYSDFDLINRGQDEAINIKIVNHEMTDELYQKLHQETEIKAITFVDNGSSLALPNIVANTEHVIRILGLQVHCATLPKSFIEGDNCFRLKDIRSSADTSEIVLRTSDVAVFNMNVIRRSDQCTYLKSNTTGLSIEEACQVAKYIGASDLINEIYFVGMDFNHDELEMLSANLVNLLWYFAEGTKLRGLDNDINDTENLVFSVVADEIDKEIQFIKSTESGRWWLKVPTQSGELHMACSERDYEDAKNNEFSDKILEAISKDI